MPVRLGLRLRPGPEIGRRAACVNLAFKPVDIPQAGRARGRGAFGASRAQESRPDEPVIGNTQIAERDIPIQRFMSNPPSIRVSGEIQSMALLAGQTVGLVTEIKSTATMVRELAHEATKLIKQRLSAMVSGV